MTTLKVALVSIARVNFDIELAEETRRAFRSNLIFNGFQVVGPPELITNPEQAQAAARALQAETFDALLVFQATFADSVMLTILAEAVDAPVVLWGVPEARTGGRLRLNSLCGINLGVHALRLRDIPYDFVYAEVDDTPAFQKVMSVAAAGQVQRRLQSARLGVVGERPDGMDTCELDEAELAARLGVNVVRFALDEAFARIQATPAAATAPVYDRLAGRLENLRALEDQGAVSRSLATYVTLKELAGEHDLDGLAVRCWPEFFEQLHCSACGALSILGNENVPSSCEADINGTITSLILQWLSGGPAFGSDLVLADSQANEMVLWHCGQAPLGMADPNRPARATIHSNRKLPLLMEFTLRPGRVTLARLSRATGELRLVIAGGEMRAAPPAFSGTTGALRFDRPVGEVVETMLTEGLEHHLSLTYGEYRPALRKLAQLLKLPVLEL